LSNRCTKRLPASANVTNRQNKAIFNGSNHFYYQRINLKRKKYQFRKKNGQKLKKRQRGTGTLLPFFQFCDQKFLFLFSNNYD